MQFDPENKIVQLCAAGMEKEGEGQPEKAHQLFLQAWNEAETDFEKFTAAHYVARHQETVARKLEWDKLALQHALRIEDAGAKAALPSLYLNVAKCYEDLGDPRQAGDHYALALSAADNLPPSGYGKMIRDGIMNGMKRVHDSLQ
jgi:tetratricopeptide (TPR) repeat protein